MTRADAVLRELQVVLVGGALVGVTLDLEQEELGVVHERRPDRVEDAVRLGEDFRGVRLELDLLQDENVSSSPDDDVAFISGAVVVLGSVSSPSVGPAQPSRRRRCCGGTCPACRGCRRCRCRIWQPSSSWKSSLSSGSLGARLCLLWMSLSLSGSVSSSSWKPSRSSGWSGHFVARVEDAVAVAVAVASLGAAVLVGSPLRVSARCRWSSTSGMPSLSLSGSGQPSSALEAVEVLGLVGALVDVVLVTVAVAVTDGRLVDEADEAAEVGALEAGRVARASAEHEVAVSVDEELDAARHLVRRPERVRRDAAREVRPVRVEHEVERVGRAIRHREAVRDAVAVLEHAAVVELLRRRHRRTRVRRRVLAAPRRVEHARVDGVNRRLAHVVRAEAAVHRDLELAGRAEALLENQLGPEQSSGGRRCR